MLWFQKDWRSFVFDSFPKSGRQKKWLFLLTNNAFGKIGPKIQAAGNQDGWTLNKRLMSLYGVAWSWYCVSTCYELNCKNLLNRSKVGPAVKQTAQPATHKADKPTSRKSTPTPSRPITNHCRAKKLRQRKATMGDKGVKLRGQVIDKPKEQMWMLKSESVSYFSSRWHDF